jgi:hypothetical protein
LVAQSPPCSAPPLPHPPLRRTVFDSYFFKLKQSLEGAAGELPDAPPMARFLAAGAGAGAITKTCVAPLERLKILFQVQAMNQSPGEAPKYRGVVHACRTVFAEEGMLAFWRGNGANVLRVIPVYALKFGFNDSFKQLVRKEGQTRLSFSQLILSGSMAGLFQACITYPLELVRTRLTLGKGLGLQYRGIWDCLVQTVRGEGVRGLYKGLSPTILSGAPYVGLQMSFYEVNSRVAKDRFGLDAGSALVKLACGASAGVCAQSLTYAGDTVRRRMQTDGAGGRARRYGGMVDCFVQVYRAEGVRGFFRGLHINCVRAVPGAAIQFLAYDSLKHLFGVGR